VRHPHRTEPIPDASKDGRWVLLGLALLWFGLFWTLGPARAWLGGSRPVGGLVLRF